MSTPAHTIRYFRMIGDKKVPHQLLLTADLTCISDLPASSEPPVPSAERRQLNEQRRALDARGIKYEEVDGSLVVTEIPQIERTLLEFFVESKPCFFPGCAQLRESYHREIEALGPACPDCDKAKIMERYREMIRPLVLLNQKP